MESETYTVWGRAEKRMWKLRLFKYRALEGPSLALWQVFLIPVMVAEMSINTVYLHAWHSFRECASILMTT